MANELTLTGSLSFSKGKAKASLSGSATADVTGTHYVQNVQEVGTEEEQLVKGDIGTIGWAIFRNTDATNFVQLGATTGVYTVKVEKGETVGPMRWNGSAIYALADTAGVALEYLIVED